MLGLVNDTSPHPWVGMGSAEAEAGPQPQRSTAMGYLDGRHGHKRQSERPSSQTWSHTPLRGVLMNVRRVTPILNVSNLSESF